MAKQEDRDRAFMKCAFAIAELSYAKRKKVGAIIVALNGGIIAEGCNGTPAGFDNCCEDTLENGETKTKAECLHAESNAIAKVACSTNSSKAATLYCTLTPCFECSKLIIQAKIIRVVYAEQYPYVGHTGISRPLGLELLAKANIQVDKLDGFTEH